MARFRWAATLVVLAVTCSGTLGASGPAAEVGVVPPPTAPPVATPPPVDGEVLALTLAGGRMVAGGHFATAASPDETVTYPRTNLMAFDVATGAVDAGFAPRLDGPVRALVPAADGRSVYVGGDFTHVDGQPSRGIARLDLATGAAVSGFAAPAIDGPVRDLGLAGGRLYLGGDFTVPGGGLAAVDPETGAVDPSLSVGFSPPSVSRVAVDGGTLVAVGPFTAVDGQSRPRVAVLDVSGDTAAVSSWATDRYGPGCAVTDVDVGPGYAVIVTAAGLRAGTLCGTVARWDTAAGGSGQEPVWVDRTGGAGLRAVAVTGSAVYAGGEQRWLNNPLGVDGAGPGAIEVAGVAALDPRNGLPLAWESGRTPGAGIRVLYASPVGLWAGGDRGSARDRLTVLPLAGPLDGPAVTEATGDLPGELFLAGPLAPGGQSETLLSRGFDPVRTPPEEPAVTVPGAAGFGDVRGAFMTEGTLWTGHRDGTLTRQSFDGAELGPQTPVDLHGLSAVADELGRATGMFFSDGRLYLTLAGESGLFYRYFTPGSGVIGAERFTATGNLPDLDWQHVAGMALAGDRLLWADGKTGVLRSAPFGAGAPVAGGSVVSTADWRARGLFVRPGSAAGATASAAQVGTSCAALACRFTGSGPDVSYAWEFGDGATATGVTATHAYAAAGRYPVTLTLTDAAGRLVTASRQVDVSAGDVPVAAFTASCSGRECRLDGGSSAGAISAYRWDLGDGTTGTGPALTHTYATDGTYPVQLTVTGGGGSGTSSRDVVVADAPVAPIAFRDGAAVAVHGLSATVTVPESVRAEDGMLLFVTSDGTATAPPGWELVDRVPGALTSALYRRVAADGDPGSAVTVTAAEPAGLDVTLLAYAGVAAVPVRAVGTAGWATPSVEVTESGAWTVSYWAGGDPPLAAPAGVVGRTSPASLAGDSGGPVPAGPYGALTASGAAAGSGTATPAVPAPPPPAVAWTVVLAPH